MINHHVWLLIHHVDRQVNPHLWVVYGALGHHHLAFLANPLQSDASGLVPWKWERCGWALGPGFHRVSSIFSSVSPMKIWPLLVDPQGGNLLSQQVESSEIVGDGTCWPGFPPNNGISRQCGYADHSPLWARIKLDCWVKKLQVGGKIWCWQRESHDELHDMDS